MAEADAADAAPQWATYRIHGGTLLHWVDTPAGCAAACAALRQRAAETNDALAVDLEGVSLSRHGEICVVQIATARRDAVFAFDICVLGGAAFAGPAGLRGLLEDENLTKVFWDCRSDAIALFFLFGVRPANVLDLQLLEVAHRFATAPAGAPRPAAVAGLAALIAKSPHARLSAAQQQRLRATKAEALRLFSPAMGGSYAVWKERPLRPTLREYCTDASLFFPIRASLRASCAALDGAAPRAALAEATARRLALSCSEEFDAVRANKYLAVGIDARLYEDLRALGLARDDGGGGGGGGPQAGGAAASAEAAGE